METPVQRAKRLIKNDTYLLKLEDIKAEYYIKHQALHRQDIGLRHLQEFVKSLTKLSDLYAEHGEDQAHFNFLMFAIETLRRELYKPYRQKYFRSLCTNTIQELQSLTTAVAGQLGNLFPFFQPLPDANPKVSKPV